MDSEVISIVSCSSAIIRGSTPAEREERDDDDDEDDDGRGSRSGGVSSAVIAMEVGDEKTWTTGAASRGE